MIERVVTDPEELKTPLLRRILKIVREEYDPEFAFRSLGPIPWTPFTKPLARARVALVTTSALHVKGDVPFDPFTRLWGDPSYRFIPHLSPDLDLTAEYVETKFIPRDPEVALPMRTLQALMDDGTVGSAASRHASFCGGVVRPCPDMEASAAAVAKAWREDGVEAAVIFPSCSLCVQNVCVIARQLERQGMATVVGSFLPELTEIVGAPRALSVPFPMGAPCGDPGNHALHRAVLEEALNLLVTASAPGTLVATVHAWREPAQRSLPRLG